MFKQYYSIRQVTGVAININKDGVPVINACSINADGKSLDFEKKIKAVESIEQLAKLLPPKTLIALNLEGKGVLQKQLPKVDELNERNFGQILPNAKIEDFYVQHFCSGDLSFVSAIRKNEANRWIDILNDSGYNVLLLSLGPFAVDNVLPQLNEYGNQVMFDGNLITRNEQGQWLSCKYNDEFVAPFPLKIESEKIDEQLLIPYAAAFQLVLFDKIDAIYADVLLLKHAFKKQIDDNKLRFQGFVILVVFFLLLLVNFIFFSWLNSSNAKLTSQVNKSAQSTSDVEQLSTQIQQKEELLKILGWEENINQSALIDQIAGLLPQEIKWKEVAINPIDLSTSRSQKNIAFYSRKIRVIGDCDKIIPVNEWIARIKTKSWVKNVQLNSYLVNNEQNTGRFTITIDY